MKKKVLTFFLVCLCLTHCTQKEAAESEGTSQAKTTTLLDSTQLKSFEHLKGKHQIQLTDSQRSGLRKRLEKIKNSTAFKDFLHNGDSAKRLRHFVHNRHDKSHDIFKKIDSALHHIKIKRHKVDVNRTVKKEVLGWYPYWVSDLDKHVNYDLVSTIAYFSYELDPNTGLPKTIHDWEKTPMLDSVKNHGNKLLLTVTNFTASKNATFLRNPTAIDQFLETVIPLLQKNQSHGVCLDFEGVAEKEKTQYSDFIIKLSKTLKKANKDYELYLACPSVDWEGSLQFEAILPYVDQFAIMGYCFYGPWSTVAGPGDPLESGTTWDKHNLSLSVDFYLANAVPSSKIILALPYYGCAWETESQNVPARSIEYIKDLPYSYIKSNIKGEQNYDNASKTAWIGYTVSNTKRQCWYDNDSMFGVKLDYILSKDLNGLGIWALGFDKGYPELYQTIDKKLGMDLPTTKTEDAPTLVNPEQLITQSDSAKTEKDTAAEEDELLNMVDVRTFIQKASDNEVLLLFIFAFVVFFGGLGFVIALLQPNTSHLIFGRSAYMVYYSSFVLLFLLILLRWLGIIQDITIALILGFILGAIVFHYVNKYVSKMKKNTP